MAVPSEAVSFLIGGVLAVGSGLVAERVRFRRRRRAAARLVFAEVMANLIACKVGIAAAHRDPHLTIGEASAEAWGEHRATLAAVRSASDFEAVRHAYLSLGNLQHLTPQAEVERFRREHPDDPSPMGVLDGLVEVVAELETAAAIVGRWSGLNKRQISDAVAGTGQPVLPGELVGRERTPAGPGKHKDLPEP